METARTTDTETSAIPKTYDSQEWEDRLYKRWETSGYFNPDHLPALEDGSPRTETFCTIMPPPNANGRLHAGPGLDMTLKDLVTRYKRMAGYKALFLPGADHAGFETQIVYERKLEKEGRTRFDMQPQELYDNILQFTLENKQYMENDVRKMGASCDWSREKFTLDPEVVTQVQKTFEKMYGDGLIYRGSRIVNWCSHHQTSLSDVETEFQEKNDPFYYFQYGPFVIGTARPETKFGDKYVVMHPEDDRYKDYTHGQTIDLEWINGPITATVIKDTAIDMEFGTGVMTITPWHDPIDFDIAERHGLDKEQIIDFDGKLLPIAGEFASLPITEARIQIVERLEKKGLLVRTETDYQHNVKVCYKCGTGIEPQIKEQWFVKMKPLAELAMAAVREEKTVFMPKRFEKIFFHWMNNTIDWNISRQIVWGIPIPVWYCLSCRKERVNATVKSRWFFVRHGETDYNKERRIQGQKESSPLNILGREQARIAGEVLRDKNIEIIFSSDLLRTQETAEIIAKELPNKQEIVLDKRLRERDLGEAEGLTYEETKERFPDIYHYAKKPANNENYQEAEERIWEAVSEHISKHPHKNVLIVSHGGTLRALLRRIHNIDPETFSTITVPKIPNAKPFSVDILEPCEHCGGHFFEQDHDTFDTWFSSGQWPLLALGYPDSQDFAEYYPTTIMETGADLVFKWVPRMIIFGMYLAGKQPFDVVYFHGMVNDEHNQKMSKSKGNVISPVELSKEFGTDAMRMSLVIGNGPGNSIPLSHQKVQSYRNFTNKLWNIGRYVLNSTNQEVRITNQANIPNQKSMADQWILGRLTDTVSEVTKHLEQYNFSLAGELLRDFTWGEFADWYVEIHKIEKNDAVLRFVWETLLKLWHPFMPFVTEALWQTMSPSADDAHLLMVAAWPRPDAIPSADSRKTESFETIIELITRIRNLRSVYRIEPARKIALTIVTETPDHIKDQQAIIERLARIETIMLSRSGDAPKNSAHLSVGNMKVYLHLEGIVDVAAERNRLAQEKTALEAYAARTEERLNNTAFTDKAPAAIITQTREELARTQQKIAHLIETLEQLA